MSTFLVKMWNVKKMHGRNNIKFTLNLRRKTQYFMSV